MKLSRLDSIVKDNVEFSTNKDVKTQQLYVLQDISVTLAMIYDKMCEKDNKEDVEKGLELE